MPNRRCTVCGYGQRHRTTVWCFRIADLFENSVYDGQPGINCLRLKALLKGAIDLICLSYAR